MQFQRFRQLKIVILIIQYFNVSNISTKVRYSEFKNLII